MRDCPGPFLSRTTLSSIDAPPLGLPQCGRESRKITIVRESLPALAIWRAT